MAQQVKLLRRLIHASSALCLLYYAVPDPVPILQIPKAAALFAGVGIVAAIEAARICKGLAPSIMRDYERTWVAGYFWLGLGCAVALAFFPERFAVPAILGTALVDPLIGELRPRAGQDAAALVGVAVWAALALLASLLANFSLALPLLVAGACSAVLAEGRKVPRVDDNLLMTLAPLLVMSGLAAALAF